MPGRNGHFLSGDHKRFLERDGMILWERTEAYVGDFGSESDALTPANTIPKRKNIASTET